ncbi:histone deacetylase KNAG_0J01300 [Huiozyma naganishii CBS 8797]|uniref:Histone deacetylase domain-containing protein n=1 Tax=Huiozyma naganishii (strain ATCC MYA-139 / BCRC 22969 / CBS 8797 / KCTC 17520 / NBRC 10181 / NCYC 3082 / Yp74L-3) TaxID=1071383 RepID=J7SAI9_HUIN7|nr:hypothetical protein KNAG_0J01300 [Kazachstania naganishii CBS 8797]CCK72211.1 hypothetical protein KNAG_0J01300 [Kazachstania naganishii CBS 8797]
MSQDPLEEFYIQFQKFVQNNPNVISAARSASQIPESAKAVIVLSPLSLQHVFSRDWVSNSYRKTIVERPERLLAASMGVAAAITMYPALFTLKTSHNRAGSLNAPHVLKVHGSRWPREVYKLCKRADEKLARGEIEVPKEWNAGDIYLSSATLTALRGTIGALETGVDTIFTGASPEHISNRVFVVVRPPGHHCHVTGPSGFCLLNNAHISIEYAADTYGVTHAAILDFDLHHGDGTQDICWKRAGFKPDGATREENEEPYDDFGKRTAAFPKVGYFSMHDINSFPTESGYATSENIRNASTCIMDSHDLNIWNVHLAPWATEEDFMKLYRSKYRTLFAKADEYFKTARLEMQKQGTPFKGLVVISAGFDASEFEQTSMQRHSVNVPTEFYTLFTKDVLKLAQMHTQGKVLSVMEGGYSDKAITSGVFAHLIGLQNQDWIREWGSEQVVKEIVRGCKPNWKPYKTKRAQDVIRIWAEEVIRLGRAMIPEFKETLFQEPSNGAATLPPGQNTIAQRLTRAQASSIPKEQIQKPEVVQASNPVSHNVPFIEQDLSSDNEDEDYEYDEALNQSFNRTVEDITIDDISRHLETLEIIQSEDEEEEQAPPKQGTYKYTTKDPRHPNNNAYKVPSNTTTEYLRHTRRQTKPKQEPPAYDDSDISMISYVSTRKHTTRSGESKW